MERLLPLFIAALGAGIAVKLMDDALDADRDAAIGLRNWAHRLGRGTTAYALLSLAVGVAAQTEWAIALWCAAYAVGMRPDWQARLPLLLRGWQETLLALAVGVSVGGVQFMIAAAALVTAIQVLDDWLDRSEDGQTPASQIDSVPAMASLLGAAALGLAGAALQPEGAAATAVAAALIQWAGRKQPCTEG